MSGEVRITFTGRLGSGKSLLLHLVKEELKNVGCKMQHKHGEHFITAFLDEQVTNKLLNKVSTK